MVITSQSSPLVDYYLAKIENITEKIFLHQLFQQEISREKHRNYCLDNESVKVEMSHMKPIVEFCDGQYQFKVPFIMYTDFESLLGPIQEPSKNRSGPWTTAINNHIPSGWCVIASLLTESFKIL